MDVVCLVACHHLVTVYTVEYGAHYRPLRSGCFPPPQGLLLRQIHDGTPRVENGYPRAVDPEGNPAASRLIDRVFETVEANWRGIGTIPATGLRLREAFVAFDAANRFDVELPEERDEIPGCRCPDVLTARAVPSDCPLFSVRCTPTSPVGPCMVGAEGACSIWFRYGGKRPL